MAKTLIENLAADVGARSATTTSTAIELLDLLEKKAEGEPLPEPQQETGGEVIDLMDALRQSVAATKKKRAPASAKPPSSSKTKTAAALGSAKLT